MTPVLDERNDRTPGILDPGPKQKQTESAGTRSTGRARASSKKILGKKFPNIHVVSAIHGQDARLQWRCQIDLQTDLTQEEATELQSLLDRNKRLEAANRLAQIRRSNWADRAFVYQAFGLGAEQRRGRDGDPGATTEKGPSIEIARDFGYSAPWKTAVRLSLLLPTSAEQADDLDAVQGDVAGILDQLQDLNDHEGGIVEAFRQALLSGGGSR